MRSKLIWENDRLHDTVGFCEKQLENWPTRCGSRIWSGGGQASEAESHRHSESELHKQSEQFVVGPGSFWVFNAQICILPHSRDSFSLIFDIYFNTKS